MARIIYTTCGTSLFTSNCWKDISECPSIFESKSPEREDYERMFRDFTMKQKENDSSGASLADKFVLEVWNDPSQITKLPAELASLKVISKFFENRNSPLNKEDKIILIHSDNEDGKYCALVIERVLKDKIKISCQVERKEIQSLDPSSAEQFNKALEKIWNFCQEMINSSPNDEYIFNLTGGYKGVAIILGGLAYKMHADANITIFYLHETTDFQEIAINGFNEGMFCSGYIEVKEGIYKNTIGSPLFQ